MSTCTSFPKQLRKVRSAGEDFEWYPTTKEIIKVLVKDFSRAINHDRYDRYSSKQNGFLDIGAGNGKVLDAIRLAPQGMEDNFTGNCYAIEKSQTLLNLLDPSIFILGCDFWNTSLHDKKIGYIFSNPPYSEFQQWTSKIIREAPAQCTIWLVVPERWENDDSIANEIAVRKAYTDILGTFDFESAEDRKARAKVHLMRIQFPKVCREIPESDEAHDPFTRFFEETFTFPEEKPKDRKPFETRIEETKIVHRLNFIEALCHLYDLRMAELQQNYQAICSISPDILKEFEISKAGLIDSLKMKLATAKKEYWERLFEGMAEINNRLTSTSRRTMFSLMQSQTGIDFNRENAYAVVLWVVKNANGYFDQQLVEVYEDLVNKASIENYVSNKRVFTWNRFAYRFCRDDDSSHYRLKVGHRMVVTHCGGLTSTYRGFGINDRACIFLSDLATVAQNLGFAVVRADLSREIEWKDSSPNVIRYIREDGKWESLMRVRAFRNSNLHIQFLPEFIHALNVQHGKLKGWLRNDDEAAAELEIPVAIARQHFKPGFRLTGSALALMAPASDDNGTPS